MNLPTLLSFGVPRCACAFVVLSSLLFAGCVSTRSIAPSESGAVRATFEQGVAVMKSEKQNTVIVRLLTSEFSNETGDFPAFYVAALNGTEQPFDFSPSNVKAFSGEAPVFVLNYEEMQKRIKREAAMQALAVALNGASQSMAASMPQQTYTSGNVNAYGSGGYAHANYSATSTTYNPAATAAANAKINANTQAQMSMIASARNANLGGLEDMLRRNTLAPGTVAGGVIRLKAPNIKEGKPLRLIVSLGEEQHEFVFQVGR